MKKDYSRSIVLQCPICGGTDFASEGENSPVRCVGCDKIFAREELIRENGASIEVEVDDTKKQIVADIRQDLRKLFKAFK